MGSLFLLAAYFVTFVSPIPSTWDINAPGCGTNPIGKRSPHHYIAGGEAANPHAYPWMAAIYKRGVFRCGGTYIKGNNGHSYILSTANCTDGIVTGDLEIRLGRHDLSVTEPSAQHISVTEITKHPLYVANTRNWDVALLRLATNPTNNVYVWPGCVPLSDKTQYETAFVIGWGTSAGGSSLPQSLHVVDRSILPHTVCRNQLGSNNYYETSMLCTAYDVDGADSCQGDNGGPLMSLRGSRVEIPGVISWGYGCADPQSPTVYHNTFKSKTWIDGIINNPV